MLNLTAGNTLHFMYPVLEYDIIFLTIEKTGRKPCFIREQIIDIAMASERNFATLPAVRSCNVCESYQSSKSSKNHTFLV